MQTGRKNYTAKDALQLLKDLELTQQANPIYHSMCSLVSLIEDPAKMCMHALM